MESDVVVGEEPVSQHTEHVASHEQCQEWQGGQQAILRMIAT